MADLAEALDAALSARYRLTEVRTPITQRRGLTGRLNQLEKLHARKGDRPGAARRRAADSAGIPLTTWTRWKSGQRKPSAASLRRIQDAYRDQVTTPALRRLLRIRKVPTRVVVTAEIRWTDSDKKKYNHTKHRTTTLVGMRPTMVACIRVWYRKDDVTALSLAETFERGASAAYSVPDDDDGAAGIQFEGDNVTITFPEED